jgi:hypothetical protein
MPFFKSLPENAGPPVVFSKYPDIYGPWSTMSQEMMNGPSPLSQGEREMILAFAAGAAGIKQGVLDELMKDVATASVDEKLKPLLAYVRKLAATPSEMTQADADAVFAAGWDEHALHDAIVITARAAFMQRLVEGHGFIPLSRETAIHHAKKRVQMGYVNLYPAFRAK